MRKHPRNSHRTAEIRPETVKRVVLYGLLLLFLSAMQCSFFARLRFLPATPDLVLCAVVGILLLDSEQAAAIAAVGGGFVLDAIGGIGVSLSPVFYLLTVTLLRLLSKKIMPGFLSYLIVLLPSLLLRASFTALGLLGAVDALSISQALRRVILPEALITLVFGMLVYALLCACRLPLRDRRDRSRH